MQVAVKCKILKVLQSNLLNQQPQVVNTQRIANELNMKYSIARDCIKILHDEGKIISDDDGMQSIITLSGLEWLNSNHFMEASQL